MSETPIEPAEPAEDVNPVLENVDDAIDLIEKFVENRFGEPIKGVGLGLLGALRAFLGVPDDYAGDID